MNKNFLSTIIIIFALLIGGCTGEANPFINRLLGVTTTIYGELKVTQEWQEMKVSKKISSASPQHYIVLIPKKPEEWELSDGYTIKTPQGETVIIEAQLIGEGGKNYQLKSYVGRPGEIHLSIIYEQGEGGKSYPKPIDGTAEKDITFTKLKIRSSQPFECSEVLWVRHIYKNKPEHQLLIQSLKIPCRAHCFFHRILILSAI